MRLLIAEDEQDLNKALSTIFKKNNYTVDSAFDGEEALVYLDNDVYDAVILDVMMPKKDGFQVLREIRTRKLNVPVLMLTARSSLDDRIEGLDGGADDYLTKPFAVAELLARVRAITRRREEKKDNVLSFKDITLDRSTYTLYGNKGNFKLANKEYQTLEMLMKTPAKVVSSEILFDKIWGYDSEAELSVVWVYISYLRKKLSALGSEVKIVAKRNLGYSLE